MIAWFLNMEGFFQLWMPDYRTKQTWMHSDEKHGNEESRNLIIIAKTLCQIPQEMR